MVCDLKPFLAWCYYSWRDVQVMCITRVGLLFSVWFERREGSELCVLLVVICVMLDFVYCFC